MLLPGHFLFSHQEESIPMQVRLLALSALFVLAVGAQTTTVPLPGLQRRVEAKVLMPSSLTQVTITGEAATVDVRVLYLTVSNPVASSDTFTIQDSDGASYAMFTNCPIAANQTYVVPLPLDAGLLFKGGVFVKSTSGNLVVRMQGRV
jgi:hypothetical protein